MSNANVTRLKRKATELEQKKQFDKALTLYIQIVDEAGRDLDDADLQLYNRVGDLLTRQGSVSEALSYYEKAVDMYAERGFLNNAIALCNKILRQAPTRTIVYYKLGKISANKGFKSDARKNFLEYADRMQAGGQRDEALRALKEFANLCPDQDDIRLMLADMLAKESRSSEAVEQLEQLYHKLEAEGRSAEARATMDRIKAIDPEITPRQTGAFQAQKNNDLVFLDLEDVSTVAVARAATPPPVTPIASPVQPDTVDVTGVGALSGLTITFLPDETDVVTTGDPMPALVAAVEGLEVAGEKGSAEVVAPLEGLDAPTDASVDALDTIVADLLPVEHGEFHAPEHPMPMLDGLADASLTLTGAQDAIPGPELDTVDVLENLEEFPAADAGPSVPPLLEETPDEWVEAALSGTGDEDHFVRLLTPLSSTVISEPELALNLEPPPLEATGGYSVDELLEIPLPAAPDLLLDTPAAATAAVDSSDVDAALGVAPPSAANDEEAVTADTRGEVAAEDVELVQPESAEAAIDESSLATVETAPLTSGEVDVAFDRVAELAPEFELAERHDAESLSVPQAPALDLTIVREVVEAHRAEAHHEESPSVDEPMTGDSVRSAFADDSVELPMLEVENGPDTEVAGTVDLGGTNIEEMLSEVPSFESEATPTFEPAPLDLGATDEWSKPEVLIDGEWREDHVGDLVTGEVYVVEKRDMDEPPDDGFDDLTAALLYNGEGEGADFPRLPTPAAPDHFTIKPTPRPSVSFGGLEAQLRRRLELEPNDVALRRQLGEALLDLGDREGGLGELETAVRELELRGDLDGARDIVDIILRVVPLSVRHHQKRVEYAVRASNRPLLVEAYTELGDALFRCGEPDKARVVYTRVIELAPDNDRARFALGMLSESPGLPRSSDEIPSIDAAIIAGAPSITIANLTPDPTAVPGEPALLGNVLPYIDAAVLNPAVAPAVEDESLDSEVDAAFSDEGEVEREVRRKTAELEAVAEWAASQPAKPAPSGESARPDDDFVDLGSWLRDDDSTPRSTRMVTADVAPSGDETADFAEMLQRFKAGVAESVDDADYESHYDLGVAFKEMGLVDEAIGQFQKALRGADFRVRAYEALGQCFVEKGQFEVAVALLQRALETAGADDLTLVGVLYLLAFANESVGRHREAVGYYQRVFAVDITFRDVAARLAALEHRSK